MKWQQKHERSLFIVSFIISLFTLTIIYFQYLGFVTLPSLPIPYISLCFGWIFYFILGMMIAKHQAYILDRLQNYKISLFFLMLFSFIS